MTTQPAEQTDIALEETLISTFSHGDITVAQIMQSHLLECEPELPLHEAARRMSEQRCSSIIVVESGRAVGIWTERDALRLDFSDPASFELPIREAMSAPVKSVTPELPLRDVAMRFRQDGVRHYLVNDAAGELLGVISQTDVVLNQGIEHYLRLRKVKSAIKRSCLVVMPEVSLGEAAALMRENRSDAVVVDYADGYGILTERDMVRLVAQQNASGSVGELASRPLLTVEESTSLYRARSMLLESRVRHIGVSDDTGHLLGLLSFSDILAGMEFVYVEELQNALRERDHALNVSRRSLHMAEKIIESSPEGIMITDASGKIESINPAFTRLTGYTEEEVLGQPPSMLSSGRHDAAYYERMWREIQEHGHWQGEIWNRRKNGEIYPELLTITAIHDENGQLTHYASLFSDITALKQSEERIRNLAYYDPLTGLPNRRLFTDRLSVAIAHARRNRRILGVMFIDLDRFKRVNDSLGHAVGDRLLQVVTERLLECVREDDTVARMGGDEFIIILSEIDDPDDAVMIARRIIASLEQPIEAEGEELVITCSLGISIYPDDGDEAETLVKNADAAMYRAKDLGRNSYQLYTPAMNARSLEHLAMETGLRKALERDELAVYYQPIIRADDGALAGAEALLRWHHPTMGLVMPADFIPLAEETDLINPIGEWVLRRVCRDIHAWRKAGFHDLNVAVNLSPRQFHQSDLLEIAHQVLVEEGVPPHHLTFELTESMLMEDAVETIRTLQQIRAMGIDISVDDFGTGYSSLNYLKRFPINKLKIDRSFMRGIAESAEDAAIVAAIISLGHSLNMDIVAEGVEKASQMQVLKAHECDLLQGFYFSQPIPADAFAAGFMKGGD